MRDENRPLFSIGVASAMSGLHPQTLRAYEARGLISPFRTPGGTRIYSENDIKELMRISEISEGGISLEGVRLILELERENANLKSDNERLSRVLEKARKRISVLEKAQPKEPVLAIVVRSNVIPIQPTND